MAECAPRHTSPARGSFGFVAPSAAGREHATINGRSLGSTRPPADTDGDQGGELRLLIRWRRWRLIRRRRWLRLHRGTAFTMTFLPHYPCRAATAAFCSVPVPSGRRGLPEGVPRSAPAPALRPAIGPRSLAAVTKIPYWAPGGRAHSLLRISEISRCAY